LAAALCLLTLLDLSLEKARRQRWKGSVKEGRATGEGGSAANGGYVEAADAAAFGLCCPLGGLGCALACLRETLFGADGGGRSSEERSAADRRARTADGRRAT
jgi:hypothetical protein